MYKNLLVLVRDGRDQQYVTALKKQTGETVWKSDRPPISTPIQEFRKSFSTPLVFEADGRMQMVVPGAQWLVESELYILNDDGFVSCVDAVSGEVLGKCRAGGSCAASPVYAEGRIYCFSREGKTVVLRANKNLTLLAEN